MKTSYTLLLSLLMLSAMQPAKAIIFSVNTLYDEENDRYVHLLADLHEEDTKFTHAFDPVVQMEYLNKLCDQQDVGLILEGAYWPEELRILREKIAKLNEIVATTQPAETPVDQVNMLVTTANNIEERHNVEVFDVRRGLNFHFGIKKMYKLLNGIAKANLPDEAFDQLGDYRDEARTIVEEIRIAMEQLSEYFKKNYVSTLHTTSAEKLFAAENVVDRIKRDFERIGLDTQSELIQPVFDQSCNQISSNLNLLLGDKDLTLPFEEFIKDDSCAEYFRYCAGTDFIRLEFNNSLLEVAFLAKILQSPYRHTILYAGGIHTQKLVPELLKRGYTLIEKSCIPCRIAKTEKLLEHREEIERQFHAEKLDLDRGTTLEDITLNFGDGDEIEIQPGEYLSRIRKSHYLHDEATIGLQMVDLAQYFAQFDITVE